MKVSETLTHELLELTRTFAFVPYNSIFMFVSYQEYHNLEFFNEHIANKLTRMLGYPKYVLDLVADIQQELTYNGNSI